MNAKKILFPSDFSTTGDEALEYAATLARESGASLLIVHVQEPPAAYGSGDYYYGLPEPDPEALRSMLENVKPPDSAVACERRLMQGDPADEIVGLARREKVDLIVMGSHGRTGLLRLLTGSVAEQVMRMAECPVLIVKSSSKARRETAARS